jgi:hypothetical protein
MRNSCDRARQPSSGRTFTSGLQTGQVLSESVNSAVTAQRKYFHRENVGAHSFGGEEHGWDEQLLS